MSEQQFNNGNDIESDDTLLLERTKPTLKKPPMFKVIILNDDYTPMEFVVHVLENFFSMDRAKATRIMMDVHKKGRGIVGMYTLDIAQTKAAQVHHLAREQEFPLKCTVEKA